MKWLGNMEIKPTQLLVCQSHMSISVTKDKDSKAHISNMYVHFYFRVQACF